MEGHAERRTAHDQKLQGVWWSYQTYLPCIQHYQKSFARKIACWISSYSQIQRRPVFCWCDSIWSQFRMVLLHSWRIRTLQGDGGRRSPIQGISASDRLLSRSPIAYLSIYGDILLANRICRDILPRPLALAWENHWHSAARASEISESTRDGWYTINPFPKPIENDALNSGRPHRFGLV